MGIIRQETGERGKKNGEIAQYPAWRALCNVLRTDPAYCPGKLPPGQEAGIGALSCSRAEIPESGRCPGPGLPA